MFCARDDFALHAGGEFHKIGAVSRHTHYKIFIILGLFPGLKEHILIINANLHMSEL